jgi:acetyl esterase/lipase
VPPQNITVVGASKGAGITVLISHLLKNKEANFVPMAIAVPK